MSSDSDAASEPTSDPALASKMKHIGDLETRAGEEHAHARLQPKTVGRDETTHVGRFELRERLGSGAMGVVYSAHDPKLDRLVALKLVGPEHAGGTDELSSRLLREAQAMARLRHPNVLRVHDVGMHREQMFIAMELVEGTSLREWLDDEPRSWQRVIDVFIEAGRGLAAAHEAGLIHRDFKPDNVLVDRSGQVFVADFGLARVARAAEHTPTEPGIDADMGIEETLTRTGAIMGTPAYMSPEAFAGVEVDARSDQYSFCASLYEAVFGVRPYEGRSLGELWFAITEQQLRPPKRRPGRRIAKRLHEVILRGLSVRPTDRWPSMDALVSRLSALRRGRRRRAVWASLTAGLLGGGTLAIFAADELATRSCIGAGQSMVDEWEQRRTKVLQRLDGIELAYAAETAAAVDAIVSDYVEQWADGRQQVCESARDSDPAAQHLVELGVACYEDRRRDLRATLDVLEDADATVVSRAVASVSSLPAVQRCADADWLRARVRPPADERTRARVAEVRERLSGVWANRTAGRGDKAKALFAPIERDAEGLQYRPVLAEIQLHRAHQTPRDDLSAREQAFSKAFFLASASGHDAVAAEASAMLVHTLLDDGRHDEAQTWIQHGLAALDRNGEDPSLRSFLFSAAGELARRRGRYDEALAHYEEAIATRKKATEPPNLLIAEVVHDIGNVYLDRGDIPNALDHYRQTMQTYEELVGHDNPIMARAHHALGNAIAKSKREDRFETARTHYERALEVLSGADDMFANTKRIHVLQALANLDWRQGDYERALGRHLETVRLYEEQYGRGHLKTATALNNVGASYYMLENLEQAQAYYERAIGIFTRTLGPDHHELMLPLKNLGEIVSRQGDHEHAIELFTRAYDMAVATHGPDHPNLDFFLVGQGAALRRAGRLDEAIDVLERSLKIAEARGDELDVARHHLELARALWPADRDRDRARELSRRAHAAFVAAGIDHAKAVREVETWWSEVGIDPSDR